MTSIVLRTGAAARKLLSKSSILKMQKTMWRTFRRKSACCRSAIRLTSQNTLAAISSKKNEMQNPVLYLFFLTFFFFSFLG